MRAKSAPAVFHVHGELTQPAISALARLLVDHARRELEEEQRAEQDQQTTLSGAATVQGVFSSSAAKEFLK